MKIITQAFRITNAKKDQQPHSWHGYSDEVAPPQDCVGNGTTGDNATTLPVSTDNGFAGDDAAAPQDCLLE